MPINLTGRGQLNPNPKIPFWVGPPPRIRRPTASDAYSQAVKDLLPTAHWRLDEQSGTTVYDYIGNRDGATINSPLLSVPGLLTTSTNTAYDFNGTNQRVSIPDDAGIRFTSGDFSVGFWVNADTMPGVGAWASCVHKTSGGQGWSLGLNNSRIYGNTNADGNGNTVLSAGTTYFIGMSFVSAAGEIRFFLNGAADGVLTGKTSPGSSTTPINFASDSGGGSAFLNGRLDEPFIINRALSPTEWANLYTLGSGAAGTAWTVNVDDVIVMSDATVQEFGTTVTIGDSVATSDAQSFDFGEGIADVLTASDAQSFDFGEAVADSVSAADSVTASQGKFVTPADSVTATDGTTQEVGKAVNPADTVTATDAQALGFGPVVADTATVTDARSLEPGKGIADSVTATDNATAQSGKEANVNDSVSATDAQTFGFGPGITDSVTMTDAQAFAFGKAIADSTSATDAITASRGLFAVIGDSVTMSDSAQAAIILAVTLADTLVLSDALAFGYGEGIADSAALSDALTVSQGFVRTAADTLTALDALYFDYGKAVADAVTLVDQRSLGFGKGQDDVLVVADSSVASWGIVRALADVLTVEDFVQLSGQAAPYTHTQLPQEGDVDLAERGGLVYLVIGDGTVTVVAAGGIIAAFEASGSPTDATASGIPSPHTSAGSGDGSVASGVQL